MAAANKAQSTVKEPNPTAKAEPVVNKPNSSGNTVSNVPKPKPTNMMKGLTVAGWLLSGYQAVEAGMDMYENGPTPMNVYSLVSTGVGTRGPVGAAASFCAEMYRRAGVWFIDRVNEANEFFRKNPLYFYQSAGFY